MGSHAPPEMFPPISTPCLQAYLNWVEAWQSAPAIDTSKSAIVLEDVAAKIVSGPVNPRLLAEVVAKFKQQARSRSISIGGEVPPTCDDTDLLSANFDPRIDCNCDGLDPTTDKILPCNAREFAGSKCKAVEAIWKKVDIVIEKNKEWNGHDLFTTEMLLEGVQELTLINTNIQPPAKTCFSTTVDDIEAPDRRRNLEVDSTKDVFSKGFPTFEDLKMSADAKWYNGMASGVSKCDAGIAKAMADAANDVIIGDYCEAADPRTLKILQDTGVAAFAFLKLCQMAGLIDAWHLDVLAAGSVHFRVLSYYRDHARPRLSKGLYGSNLGSLEAQRYTDLGIASPIVIASMASGQKLSGQEYRKLCRACVFLNDMFDVRSDATRVQRENPVLRGVRENVCKYFSGMMVECISLVTSLISSNLTAGLVALAFTNWGLLASHHKAHEIVMGVEQIKGVELCDYGGMEEYSKLLAVLEPLGTTAGTPPDVRMKRAELELLYSKARLSHETHLAWLADTARSLLHPRNFRAIVDVAHFRWTGCTGDVDYCP
ncbi:High-affinity methionine permease [Venturia inaequalis]|nr:High-affinity methionine permease [Venturia inaequalis]